MTESQVSRTSESSSSPYMESNEAFSRWLSLVAVVGAGFFFVTRQGQQQRKISAARLPFGLVVLVLIV